LKLFNNLTKMSSCRPIYQDVREVGKTVKSYVISHL
jgi:hypothetical protein